MGEISQVLGQRGLDNRESGGPFVTELAMSNAEPIPIDRHDGAFSPLPKSPLRKTALNALHRELGAKLVPFAGYEMPLQYAAGIVREHLHVRASAGLFDVSHMGQAALTGPSFEAIASALEAVMPGDILGLKPGGMRYTQLLNGEGGIIDDLMVMRPREGDGVTLVVNASRKEIDFAYLAKNLPAGIVLTPLPGLSLIALQGPAAADVLEQYAAGSDRLPFLNWGAFDSQFGQLSISRSGYTGEDGFEISLPSAEAEALVRALLQDERVLPIGLGARDTLRLEAGLCLYGQDMDEAATPIEAGLAFSIGKRRRREANFPGAQRILQELADGPKRQRVGLVLEGRAAARSGMAILDPEGRTVGQITSGAFTPSAAASIAMGYVAHNLIEPGTALAVTIRGNPIPAKVVAPPFVPHRYARIPANRSSKG